MTSFDRLMEIALEEAGTSLKEGNNGFGAVIENNGEIIAQAHDTEESENDPTSHAELNVIRRASKKLGRDLSGCTLVATHEPCPMCAAAVVWSGISKLAYGYSIKEALAAGRKRIDLTCKELFERAGKDITVVERVLHERCSILYRKDVREEIKRLRGSTADDRAKFCEQLLEKRIAWYEKNRENLNIDGTNLLMSAYRVFLQKIETQQEYVPLIETGDNRIVFHSKNFCPTLEACKLLDLDTRTICKECNEKPTDTLVKLISPRLEFGRNYEKLRPYSEYCEELFILNDAD